MPQDKKYKFALVPKAMNNPFFDLARDGCKKAQEELKGEVECLYIGPGEHTEAEQVQIVQDLITQGVYGIAVSPSNAAAMASALKTAKEANIPTHHLGCRSAAGRQAVAHRFYRHQEL